MPNEQNNSQEPEVEVDSGQLIASLDKATIDIQISTARAYPRSLDKVRKDALALATADEATALSMFYVLPRANSKIEGATIRFAEVIGSCWGNIRYGARVVNTDETFITAQGMAFDLEKNIAITMEVRRRIRDKYNRRYNDDMIQVTGNAACSIALRNAILRIVPGWKSIYEQAKAASTGKGQTMDVRVANAIKAFNQMGAKTVDILRVLKRRCIPDITLDDLIMLNGIRTAIQYGETTWGQILDDLPKSEEEMAEQLKRDFKGPFETTAEAIIPDRPEASAAGSESAEASSPPPRSSTTPRAGGSSEDRLLNKQELSDLDEMCVSLGIEDDDVSQALFEYTGGKITSRRKLPVSQLAGFIKQLQGASSAPARPMN